MNRLQNIASFLESEAMRFVYVADETAYRRTQADALSALDEIMGKAWRAGVDIERGQLEQKTGGASATTYVVRDGDTFEKIALLFNATYEQIVAMNPTIPIGPLTANTSVTVP